MGHVLECFYCVLSQSILMIGANTQYSMALAGKEQEGIMELGFCKKLLSVLCEPLVTNKNELGGNIKNRVPPQ